MKKIMRYLSVLFFLLSILIVAIYTLGLFAIQFFLLLNIYWLLLLFSLTSLVYIYKNPNYSSLNRYFTYLLVLVNCYMVYGVNLACYGEYSLAIIPNTFCLNFDYIIKEANGTFDYLRKYLIILGLFMFELSLFFRSKSGDKYRFS